MSEEQQIAVDEVAGVPGVDIDDGNDKSVVFIGTPETGRSPADGIPTVDRRGPVRVDRQAMFTAVVNAMLAGVKPPAPPTGETPAIMPATPPKHYPALVGRNDRCPCGSGRKYKKCHTGRAITDRIET